MLKLTIETRNAAFGEETAFEVARILHNVAERIAVGGAIGDYRLRDINGNVVGTARFEEAGNE